MQKYFHLTRLLTVFTVALSTSSVQSAEVPSQPLEKSNMDPESSVLNDSGTDNTVDMADMTLWKTDFGAYDSSPLQINAQPAGDGKTSYYIAPLEMLGDWRNYSSLSFEKMSWGGSYYKPDSYGAFGDVVIRNGEMTARYDLQADHSKQWQPYSIPLQGDIWQLSGGTHNIDDILKNVTEFKIRAEYGVGTDYSSLKNLAPIKRATQKNLPPSPKKTGISISSATYGGNCGVSEGNVTSHISNQCNGKYDCRYIVDHKIIGDPSAGCEKTYTVNYRCGNALEIYKTSLVAEAGWGDKAVELKCQHAMTEVAEGPASTEMPQVTKTPGLKQTAVKEARKKPLKIEGKKILPLRVLARPFSNIYENNNVESGVVVSNIAALKPFYVYEKPTPEEKELEDGWYQIGTNTRGKIIGWMQAKDVFEWNQTMCLVYTHPEGRKPVLMFGRESSLKSILELPDDQRKAEIQTYFTSIEENNIPKNFPITSVEPKRAVDWKKEFYFLPILNHKAITFGNREARIIQLTATTNARPDARQATDIRENKGYLSNAISKSTKVSKSDLKSLKVNIVWVADTTVSMRPYINRTLEVIESVSKKIANEEETNIAMKFGIWGYRDNQEAIPKIGYLTKNYTPKLVPVDDFYEVLQDVKVTPVDSVDYPEDMFSGINEAIINTQWEKDALRFIILVGDAPSHEIGHDWNLSGQSAVTLRVAANDRDISIFAVHINNPKAKKYEETARTQYTILATNTGAPDPQFKQVISSDKEQFSQITDDLTALFTDSINNLKQQAKEKEPPKGGGNAQDVPPTKKPPVPFEGESAFLEEEIDIDDILKPNNTETEKNTTKTLANAMFRAALIKWIGSQTNTKPPRDIVAWAIDKDLENPDIPSVEVRLLINKRQLDSLATVLDSIIKAGIQGQISGEDFFSSLQATTAMISRDPNMISQAKRIAETGLVPEFLIGLPYKSKLMAIDNKLWEGWSADEQMDFINDMSSKVEAYSDIHDSSDGWIQLNTDDDPDEYVYPISLDLLP